MAVKQNRTPLALDCWISRSIARPCAELRGIPTGMNKGPLWISCQECKISAHVESIRWCWLLGLTAGRRSASVVGMNTAEAIEAFSKRPDLDLLLAAAEDHARTATGGALELLTDLLPVLRAAVERRDTTAPDLLRS